MSNQENLLKKNIACDFHENILNDCYLLIYTPTHPYTPTHQPHKRTHQHPPHIHPPHKHTHIRTPHTDTHTQTHTNTHIHMYPHTNTYTYTPTQTHTSARVRILTNTPTHMHPPTYLCIMLFNILFFILGIYCGLVWFLCLMAYQLSLGYLMPRPFS